MFAGKVAVELLSGGYLESLEQLAAGKLADTEEDVALTARNVLGHAQEVAAMHSSAEPSTLEQKLNMIRNRKAPS